MNHPRLLVWLAAAALICSSATAAAQEVAPAWQRVELGAGAQPYPFAIYSNRPWDGDMRGVQSAVLVFHGLGRNGAGYFRTANTLAIESGSGALVIAPNFFTAADARKHAIEGLPLWRGSRWNHGADAENWPQPLSSFQVIDDLLRALLDSRRFPQLEHIVLAGHSGGGQLVHRYAVLNEIDGEARATGRRIRYVIANPSSYLYLTPERPSGAGFAPYDVSACPDYNQYRYGIENPVRYIRSVNPAILIQRFAAREVAYLLGSQDNDSDHAQLDKSCGAQAGGRHRLERGLNYLRYERHLAGNTVTLNRQAYLVTGAGHSQSRMFGSQCGAALLFGLAEAMSSAAAACRAPEL